MCDVNALDLLYYEAGGYYILDHGYIDFHRLYRIHQSSSFFITRAKSNFKFKRMYSNDVCKEKGVVVDQIGKLKGYYITVK